MSGATTLTRTGVDFGPKYHEQLASTERPGDRDDDTGRDGGVRKVETRMRIGDYEIIDTVGDGNHGVYHTARPPRDSG